MSDITIPEQSGIRKQIAPAVQILEQVHAASSRELTAPALLALSTQLAEAARLYAFAAGLEVAHA